MAPTAVLSNNSPLKLVIIAFQRNTQLLYPTPGTEE